MRAAPKLEVESLLPPAREFKFKFTFAFATMIPAGPTKLKRERGRMGATIRLPSLNARRASESLKKERISPNRKQLRAEFDSPPVWLSGSVMRSKSDALLEFDAGRRATRKCPPQNYYIVFINRLN